MSQLAGERCPKCNGKGTIYMKNIDRPSMKECQECRGTGVAV